MKRDRKYLNAINILLSGNQGALHRMYRAFGGNFDKAYHSDFYPYINKRNLPSDTSIDKIRILKKTINIEKEYARLKRDSIDITTILDKDYPAQLKQISDPPFLLYVRGDKTLLNSECFAVVGTRKITDYGKVVMPYIVNDIANAGLIIVSGLATGIDTLAHRAALETKNKTIAVFGTGLNDESVFPSNNLGLVREILSTGGALVSEYAPGTGGTKYSFPKRNRIISGLSKGVLVVEADRKSGSVITANSALDQNRDVFAIPGNIFSQTSAGTNYLIKQGAKLVAQAQDILEEYDLNVNNIDVNIIADNILEKKILSVLSKQPLTVDDIIAKSGLDVVDVTSTLTVMEVTRKVKEIGNRKFILYS